MGNTFSTFRNVPLTAWLACLWNSSTQYDGQDVGRGHGIPPDAKKERAESFVTSAGMFQTILQAGLAYT
jgi:hypothetical protein